MNIYCLQGFNNYYNRVVKKFNTIEEYEIFQRNNSKKMIPCLGINFVPNDCVNTRQILNWSQNWIPDYFIVENPSDNSFTRWFVVESVRERGSQYSFTLRRDLLADFNETILNAPTFIEKATLNDDNPLIFNEESLIVNQIKTDETLIMDRTKSAWLIGYYSKNTELEGSVPINISEDIPHIKLDGSIELWDYYKYSNLSQSPEVFKGPASSGNYIFRAKYLSSSGLAYNYYTYKVNIQNGNTKSGNTNTDLSVSCSDGQSILISRIQDAFINYGLSNLNYVSYTNNQTQDSLDQLLTFNGSTIKDPVSGKYYKIKINSKNIINNITAIASGSIYEAFETILKPLFNSYTPNDKSFAIETSYIEYSVELEELKNLAFSYNITENKILTTDAPWDIFAIPYGKVNITDLTSTFNITTNKEDSLSIISAMQYNHPTVIYDIQLLPYCPIQDLISDEGQIILKNEKQYTLIKREEDKTIAGIIFHVPKSIFYFDITSIQIPQGQTSIEKKLNNECDKWRLTSPNYSNYFDFSVEKNNGIEFFNVDCNYKPFTPYIHINPNFNGLYGYDDNSPRGLILGGDFSISQIIDQWQQYQIQNKNFQNIFDRQIQNMEIQHKYQRIQDVSNALVGSVTGAVGGAMTGSIIGGGLGPIGGAFIGGAASAIGGAVDITINEKLRNESLDYTKDLFGYQLGNIQALPNTISKVSSLNNNNKIFPILEYYTCKDYEKEAFLNKVAWNGMTVMCIGKINDFINNRWEYTINDKIISSKNYIKGKIIRLEDINCDDFHIANEIGNEVFKGAFYELF